MDEDNKAFWKAMLHLLLWVLLVGAVIGLLAGCSTARKVSSLSETQSATAVADSALLVHRETVERDRWLRDTVTVRDSVFVMQRGDTVVIREWHWRERERNGAMAISSATADTAWRDRVVTRTITQRHETVKEVPRRRSWWEWTLLALGGAAVAAAAWSTVSIWRKGR